MPVSRTEIRIFDIAKGEVGNSSLVGLFVGAITSDKGFSSNGSGISEAYFSSTQTSPLSVNLIALETKLVITCLIRIES